MNRVRGILSLVVVTLAFGAGVAVAQPPTLILAPPECLPAEGQAAVAVAVTPEIEEREIRVYFRRQGHGDFYYLVAEAAGGGGYWAVLPIPEPDNDFAEVYAAAFDPDGNLVGRSEGATVPIYEDCDVDLTREQADYADSLSVGETSWAQKDRKVAWWQCEHVDERIDVAGDVRDEDACVPVAYWWRNPAILVPLGIGGVGGVLLIDDIINDGPPPEASPSAP